VACLGRFLEAGREVERVTHRATFHVGDHDEPRRDADPDVDPATSGQLERGRRGDDGAAGANRPLCFALVCERVTEERHDAVAESLVHVATEARDARGAHVFVASHYLVQDLRVEPVGKSRESDHVAKKHRQLATFPD